MSCVVHVKVVKIPRMIGDGRDGGFFFSLLETV